MVIAKPGIPKGKQKKPKKIKKKSRFPIRKT